MKPSQSATLNSHTTQTWCAAAATHDDTGNSTDQVLRWRVDAGRHDGQNLPESGWQKLWCSDGLPGPARSRTEPARGQTVKCLNERKTHQKTDMWESGTIVRTGKDKVCASFSNLNVKQLKEHNELHILLDILTPTLVPADVRHFLPHLCKSNKWNWADNMFISTLLMFVSDAAQDCGGV